VTRTYGRIKTAPAPTAYRCEFTDGSVYYPSTAGSDMAGLLPGARMIVASINGALLGKRTGRRLAAITEVR
jgi:hypothetical protein